MNRKQVTFPDFDFGQLPQAVVGPLDFDFGQLLQAVVGPLGDHVLRLVRGVALVIFPEMPWVC